MLDLNCADPTGRLKEFCFFCFGSDAVHYLPLQSKLVLQKKKAKDGKSKYDTEDKDFPVPASVSVIRTELTQEEEEARDEARDRFLEMIKDPSQELIVVDNHGGLGHGHSISWPWPAPTPTGPRTLVRAGPFRDQVFDGLVRCMQQLTDQMKASSLHITFPERQEWEKVAKLGYLQRKGLPYHWKNRNYSNFNDFLMDLKQSKRKNIRQERKKVVAQNITMKRLGGDDIKPYHWDAFYNFYRNSKHY